MRRGDVQQPYVTGGCIQTDTAEGEASHFVDAAEMVEGRGSVLMEAHRVINGERQQQYGSPEDSHTVIAEMWSGYLQARQSAGHSAALAPSDVAHMMVLFKIARQLNGAGKRDNYVDAAGYIAIASDMQEARQ